MNVVNLYNHSSRRKKLFLVMGRPNQLPLNQRFNSLMATLILLNILAVIIETIPSVYQQYKIQLYYFDLVSVIIFTIEYLSRLWCCVEEENLGSGIKGRIRFIFSPMALVDLVAILPFIIPMFINLDLRTLRILRLFRIFRIFKFARYSLAIRTIAKVLKSKESELLIAFLFGFSILLFSSSLMYFVEHEAQPDKFSSIPETMWWGVATLTTVGYGDIYPITSLGKFLGAIISFLGVCFFALPAGIIASGFANTEINHSDKKSTCPHCNSINLDKTG